MAAQSASGKKTGKATSVRFGRDDLPYIRKELRRFLVALSVAIVLVGGTGWLALLQQRELGIARQQRDQAVAKAVEIEHEKREIRDFRPKYLALRERGFIGDENRLEWVEEIARIRGAHGIDTVAYEIEPRDDYEVDPQVPMGGLTLRASRVNLAAKLLHEGDLVHLLDGLKARFVLVPQRCSIQRIAGVQAGTLTPRLEASCSLLWPTLNEPAPPDSSAAAAAAQQ